MPRVLMLFILVVGWYFPVSAGASEGQVLVVEDGLFRVDATRKTVRGDTSFPAGSEDEACLFYDDWVNQGRPFLRVDGAIFRCGIVDPDFVCLSSDVWHERLAQRVSDKESLGANEACEVLSSSVSPERIMVEIACDAATNLPQSYLWTVDFNGDTATEYELRVFDGERLAREEVFREYRRDKDCLPRFMLE
jgi:hypothetical protein